MSTYKIIIILLLLFPILLLNCENNDGIVDITYWNKSFKGITFTDEEGNILQVDNTDWKLSLWTEYSYLFSSEYDEINPTDGNYALSSTNNIHPVYPNPTNRRTTIAFSVPKILHVEMKIIDSDLNVVKELINRRIPAGRYMISIDLNSFSSYTYGNSVYRCIYKIGPYTGYGDIWFKKLN